MNIKMGNSREIAGSICENCFAQIGSLPETHSNESKYIYKWWKCNDSDSDYTYNNNFFPFASILFSRFVYLLRSMKFHSTAASERVSIKQQRTETRKKEI